MFFSLLLILLHPQVALVFIGLFWEAFPTTTCFICFMESSPGSFLSHPNVVFWLVSTQVKMLTTLCAKWQWQQHWIWDNGNSTQKGVVRRVKQEQTLLHSGTKKLLKHSTWLCMFMNRHNQLATFDGYWHCRKLNLPLQIVVDGRRRQHTHTDTLEHIHHCSLFYLKLEEVADFSQLATDVKNSSAEPEAAAATNELRIGRGRSPRHSEEVGERTTACRGGAGLSWRWGVKWARSQYACAIFQKLLKWRAQAKLRCNFCNFCNCLILINLNWRTIRERQREVNWTAESSYTTRLFQPSALWTQHATMLH